MTDSAISPGVPETATRAASAAVVASFALVLAMHLLWLGSAPLAGTEGHRALTAHQMNQGGEYLLPRLYGRLFMTKPPLHYWILAAAERITGRANEWVWRFPSALWAAALAGFIAWISGRWFGGLAGWAGGLCYASLIPLWAQSRSADIDSANTLAATVCAAGILELMWGPAQPWRWTIATALAAATAFMLKGPTGLSVVAGLLVWILIARKWPMLARPWPWVALAAGACVFVVYLVAVKVTASHAGIPLDSRGIQELKRNLALQDWRRYLKALLLAPQLFIFTLTASWALVVWWRSPWRSHQRATALAGTVLSSWGLLTVIGMINPRYAYVTLPLLCPLAAAILSPVLARRRWQRILVIWAMCILVAAGGLARYDVSRRQKRSAYVAAQELRRIVPAGQMILAGWATEMQPELFYYAGLNASALTNSEFRPEKIGGGRWVLMDSREWELFNARAAGRLEHVHELQSNRETLYVAYLKGP